MRFSIPAIRRRKHPEHLPSMNYAAHSGRPALLLPLARDTAAPREPQRRARKLVTNPHRSLIGQAEPVGPVGPVD
jgi:hypothetical protein